MEEATAGAVQRMLKGHWEKALADLENKYEAARKEEVAELRNAFVECIADLGPSPANTLLVLEMLKLETLELAIEHYRAEAMSIPLTDAEPTPMMTAGADGS